jgi:ribose transport system ATP-binding protein
MQKISPPLMARNGIHLVPGDRKSQGAISEFNVRENMTLGDLAPFRRHGHLCTKVEKELVEHWIGELDLVPPNPEHDYLTLSGGNQQKVIVAKWLAVNPKVLILDEPTNGVDIGAREKIYSVIRDQASRGLAFIICSSDAGELAELCDRILVLNDGKIISELIGEQVNEINVVDHLHAVNEQKTH